MIVVLLVVCTPACIPFFNAYVCVRACLRVFVFCLTASSSFVVVMPQAPSLVRTILGHGARVNTARGDRRIPLHTAMRLPAGKKKLSIVATLLVVGADIDRPGVVWARGGGWGGGGCCAPF